MKNHHNLNDELPLRQRLTPIYILSAVIAILMAAASIAGLLLRTKIYPTDDLLLSFLPTDVTILSIGLPMMLISMWFTRRGRLIGLLLWPGAIFFTLYTYLTYILAMPLSVAFLLQLALVILCTYTLIAMLSCIDTKAVQQKLAGAIPAHLSGGILAGLGLIFLGRAVAMMITASIGGAPMAEVDFAINITDSLTAPAWILCGVLLWKRKTWGVVAGLGMLFQGSMLFIGLIIVMLLQPFLMDMPIAWMDVLVVFTMGLVCFVPFALYVRAVISKPRSKSKEFQKHFPVPTNKG